MIEFLQLEDVLQIHSNQVELYGGEHGVRDMGLLDSAVAQPRLSFDGRYLHGDLFDMAGAYMFHLVQNHPFLDGNKRVGAAAALVFLDLNNVEIEVARGELYDLTMAVAQGQTGKAEIAEFLRQRAQ